MKTILPKSLLSVVLLLLMHNVWAQKFFNPIASPPTLKGTTFTFKAHESAASFSPMQDTLNLRNKDTNNARMIPTLCYNQTGVTNMGYLGPTLIWRKTDSLNFNISNDLPPSEGETTVHWHGVNLPSDMDGGPHEMIMPGMMWDMPVKPAFRIVDNVQTVWYHSHVMDRTTEQVTKGLAGMIILEDPINDPNWAVLPHQYDTNDFPIVIQEKGFNYTNVIKGNDTIVTATSMQAGNKPGTNPFTLINGVMNGYLQVPAKLVRLRFLNGSHRKSFYVAVTSNRTETNTANFKNMYLVATDGGYTDSAYAMKTMLISPGERMEMLVDFTGMSATDTLYLRNLVERMPLDIVQGNGNGPAPLKATPGHAFMAFVPNSTKQAPTLSVPTGQLSSNPVVLSDTVRSRYKVLGNSAGGSGTGGFWTIDGDTMDMGRIDDTVVVNTKEKWTIHNSTNIAHPFHIHKVQFQVVEYIGNIGVDSTNQSVPDTFRYNVTVPGNKLFPLPPYLRGYKDDVLVRAGSTMTFIAKFDFYGDTEIDTMNGFMYHCHILTHEDHAMMNQFVVVNADVLLGTKKDKASMGSLTLYPNPAGNVIHLKGVTQQAGTIRISDLLGRTLKEENVSAFNGTSSILVGDLPRGMILVEWTSGNNRVVQKVFLK